MKSNNFLFLFEIEENKIDNFIQQIGQLPVFHINNPNKEKFIYQNGSLIYLYV